MRQFRRTFPGAKDIQQFEERDDLKPAQGWKEDITKEGLGEKIGVACMFIWDGVSMVL